MSVIGYTSPFLWDGNANIVKWRWYANGLLPDLHAFSRCLYSAASIFTATIRSRLWLSYLLSVYKSGQYLMMELGAIEDEDFLIFPIEFGHILFVTTRAIVVVTNKPYIQKNDF